MKEKNKGGRPKEKLSDKVDFEQLTLLCEKGWTDKELAEFFKVTRDTISRWKRNDEFLIHLKGAKDQADKRVERSLYERATGYNHKDTQMFCYQGQIVTKEYIKYYPPDATSMIFWLKNRKPNEWRDKQDVELSGNVKTVSETTIFSLKTKGR